MFGGLWLPADGAAQEEATREQAAREQAVRAEIEQAYRDARVAIARGHYERAADLFAEFRDRYRDSQFDSDASYWQAFAMYRMEAYREALAVLEAQRLVEGEAAGLNAEARELQLRLQSQLGRAGDARAAEAALREAEMALAVVQAQRSERESNMQRAMMEAEEALALTQMDARRANERSAMAMRIAAVRAGQAQEACEGDEVRQAAIQALMEMETERAIPLLTGVLQDRQECAVSLRKQAIFVLGQYEDAGVEDLMIDVLRNDPDPGVQEAAVFWLSQVETESALDALAEVLRSSDNAQLQENAIFALSQQQGAEASELLRAYLLDSQQPDRVRVRAMEWLLQNPEYAEAGLLMDLYGQLDATSLKDYVFMAVSQQDDPEAIDWVLERALDPNEDVELRKQALFWAGQHEAVEFGRLAGLYDQLGDSGMKEQLIFLYGQRDEAARVDRLIDIVRNEEDETLRKRAIFWLGQTGDERAIEFLLELAEDPR